MDNLETFFPFVTRPARYLGGETGIVDHRPDGLRVVLCYPDVYEIGMSHRGFLNIYAAVASCPGVNVQRAFAPWPDMVHELRRSRLPLTSLEERIPLWQADVVAFSFSTPLSFATGVQMLLLAGITPLAKDRNDDAPLVIAGGEAMFNAEPAAPFLDAVVIGEGEEVIREIASFLLAAKNERTPREGIVRGLASLPGVYVPSLYEPRYANGEFAGIEPKYAAPPRVKKRVLTDITNLPAPALVANIPPVQDRLAVEVMRGCMWWCRFCQAGAVTKPPRERPAAACLAEAETLYRATGIPEISLLALNACDYSQIEPILNQMRSRYPNVKLTLPSLRVRSYRADVGVAAATQKRSQQTFAPEVGTDRLRAVINKGFTNEDVITTVRTAGSAGYQNVKLYFMVGLPTETDDDAEAIGYLIAACKGALREGLGRWGKLSVTISPFVPQAHTAFQWEGMCPPQTLARRLSLARSKIPRSVHVEGRVGTRTLEACLSRGDRRLAEVILRAVHAGAYLDNWNDFFKREAWEQAFAAAGLNMEEYATRRIDVQAPLPWDHIDAGVRKSFLIEEYEKALAGELSPPCPTTGSCRKCGVCTDQLTATKAAAASSVTLREDAAHDTRPRMRLRFKYAKEGRWRWLSHLELWRLLRAQLLRAGVPLARTSGFSPRERLNLAPALPVGVAGAAELGEVVLSSVMPPDEFASRVNGAGPFVVAAVKEIPLSAPSLESIITGAQIDANLKPAARAAGVSEDTVARNVARVLEVGDWKITTAKGKIDARPFITVDGWDSVSLTLKFTLAAGPVGVKDVVSHLSGLDAEASAAAEINRLAVLTREEVEN